MAGSPEWLDHLPGHSLQVFVYGFLGSPRTAVFLRQHLGVVLLFSLKAVRASFGSGILGQLIGHVSRM